MLAILSAPAERTELQNMLLADAGNKLIEQQLASGNFNPKLALGYVVAIIITVIMIIIIIIIGIIIIIIISIIIITVVR